MKGTVTISLEDYSKLTKKNELLKNKEEYLYQTAKELSVFLSFLSSRENMDKYIQQFNLQSKTSKIKFEGNKAVIEFRDVEN
jgi:hypothetical protein